MRVRSVLTTSSLVLAATVPLAPGAGAIVAPPVTVTVTTEDDEPSSIDDHCAPEYEGAEECSLREAVNYVEGQLGSGGTSYVIEFADGVSSITLYRGSHATDTDRDGDLDLAAESGTVVIDGGGVVTVTSTAGRILDVADTTPPTEPGTRLSVELRDLTLTGGDTAGDRECAYAVENTTAPSEDRAWACAGGAVRSLNTALSTSGVTFSDNTIADLPGPDPAPGWGGAVAIRGGTYGSTGDAFTGNEAPTGWGGAIYAGALATEEAPPADGNPVVTLTDTDLTGNLACQGGAVWLGDEDTLNVRGGSFEDNVATMTTDDIGSQGGAIYARRSTVDIRASETSATTFRRNVARSGRDDNATPEDLSDDTYTGTRGQGGAIATGWTFGATVDIQDAVFEYNQSVEGGALYAGEFNRLTVDSSELSRNTAWRGGAVFQHGATSHLDDVLLEGNRATCPVLGCPDGNGRGGAIFAEPSELFIRTVYLSGSTLVDNSSQLEGALALSGESAYITNSTFSGNENGAIAAREDAHEGGTSFPTVVIARVTFTGNAGDGRAAVIAERRDGRTSVSFENALFVETGGADCDVTEGTLAGADRVVSSDTSCGNAATSGLSLRPLDDHDTERTQVHALPTGSPAIDVFDAYDDGGPSCSVASEPHFGERMIDQRGLSAPVDGDGDEVAKCDAGAFEYRDADASTPTTPRPRPAPANRAPIGEDDLVYADAGLPVRVDVLANDSDPEGGPLTVAAVAAAQHGAITGDDVLVYEPNEGFIGQDSFSYTVEDELGATDTATVTIIVEAPGDLSQACPSKDVPEDGFDDVPTGNVHEYGIDCGAWWGFLDGFGDRRFGPSELTTRAQAASTVADIIRTAGDLPTGADDPFIDECSAAHEANVRALAAADVMNGYADGRFGCADSITRGQLAAVMLRAYAFVTGTTPTWSGERVFTDTTTSTHDAAIHAAYELGLVLGKTDTTFAPGSSIRRDEIGSIVVRLLDRLVEEGYAVPPSA